METFASVAAAGKTAWENLGETVRFASASIAATAIGAWEDIKHFFVSTMPTVLEWFRDNWRDVLTDVGNLLKTVGENLFINLGVIAENITNFLRGDPQRYRFVALTEGFESTLRELPVIAGRELTELEQFWQQRAAKIGDILASAYHDNLQGMREMFGLVRREAEDLASWPLTDSAEPEHHHCHGVARERETRKPEQRSREASRAWRPSLTAFNHPLLESVQTILRFEQSRPATPKLTDVARGIHELARRDPVGPIQEGNRLLQQQVAASQQIAAAITRIRPTRPGILAE
jgi:hypothetical protein